MSRGARCYMVTVFAPAGEELRLLDPATWPNCSFFVYQREVCPRTSREHFQCYMELVDQARFTTLQATCEGLDDDGASVTFLPRRGTQIHAIAYCQKPDPYKGYHEFKDDTSRIEGPWFYGEPKHQGQRADLLAIQRDIRCGKRIKDIAEDDFPTWVKYHKAFNEYTRIFRPVRDFLTRFLILYGPSRVGKSQLARQMAPDAYWKPPGKWWNDYEHHSAVVWDEFSGSSYPFRELLRILDSTPLQLESKGSSVQFVADFIIFTTNIHPKDWYSSDIVSWDDSPLRHRINDYGCIIDMSPVVVPNLCPYCPGLCAFHHP